MPPFVIICENESHVSESINYDEEPTNYTTGEILRSTLSLLVAHRYISHTFDFAGNNASYNPPSPLFRYSHRNGWAVLKPSSSGSFYYHCKWCFSKLILVQTQLAFRHANQNSREEASFAMWNDESLLAKATQLVGLFPTGSWLHQVKPISLEDIVLQTLGIFLFTGYPLFVDFSP